MPDKSKTICESSLIDISTKVASVDSQDADKNSASDVGDRSKSDKLAGTLHECPPVDCPSSRDDATGVWCSGEGKSCGDDTDIEGEVQRREKVEGDRRIIGLIAQEVQQVLPHAVIETVRQDIKNNDRCHRGD